MTKHFTHLHEYDADTIQYLVEASIQIKQRPPSDAPLHGKHIALCFMNPSLRTRVSFEIAALKRERRAKNPLEKSG